MYRLPVTFRVVQAPVPRLEIQLRLPCFYGNTEPESQIRLAEFWRSET